MSKPKLDKSQLPKLFREYYQQYKAKNPVLALSLSGFCSVSYDRNPRSIQTQDQWTSFLNESDSCTSIEPWHGLSISGHVLLTAIDDGKNELVKQLLDMGFDPREVYEPEGTNALHFAGWTCNLPLLKRLCGPEFKMSMIDKDASGELGLKWFGNKRGVTITPEIKDWLYSLPDYKQIMNANVGTLIYREMQDYEKKKEMMSQNTEKTTVVEKTKETEKPKEPEKPKQNFNQPTISQLRASIFNSKFNTCNIQKFFDNMVVLIDASGSDEKSKLESVKKMIDTDPLLNEKYIREWFKLNNYTS